jgi:hypothetical protein
VAYPLLQTLLLGPEAALSPQPRCHIVVGGGLHFNFEQLNRAVDASTAGDYVAYAVPLEASPLHRLWTLATLKLRLRRAARLVRQKGLAGVCTYGIDPHLDSPTFAYEWNSVASQYADRFLRARGSRAVLRMCITRLVGCDPAVGGIVVMGRRS